MALGREMLNYTLLNANGQFLQEEDSLLVEGPYEDLEPLTYAADYNKISWYVWPFLNGSNAFYTLNPS